jgi:Fur family ferric uptake transcriptional regulator
MEFRNEDIESLQLKTATSHGFHMLQHRMEIYGICSDCLKKRSPLMPLTMAKSGETVIIKDLMGGKSSRGRLASMGLRPGDQLEIINNNGQGRLIVGHECTRLGLGRGIAGKIMVSLSPQTQSRECIE